MSSYIWSLLSKTYLTEGNGINGAIDDMKNAVYQATHNVEDETHMTTPEIIFFHGYQAETHHIWTDDGYRLEAHRVIPPVSANKNCGKSIFDNDHKQKQRPTILVHHGLLSSSADWLLLGPNKAMAFLLCDEGYDVWLANARGNRYSQCHKQYTTKDPKFWDFSWHEIGYYDLPALIDYIVDKTGNPDMHYIGYSQGTTAFFVMASERPEYNDKIKGMVCLAPIAYLGNHRSPLLKCVVPLHIVMKWARTYCNINELFPRNKLQSFAFSTIMRNAPDTLAHTFCNCWFYLIAGFGSDQLDKSMLPMIFGHFPAGASAKQIIHYSQAIQSSSFQQFDNGTKENLKLYGTKEPPKYDLTKVKVPVAIFHSDNDFLNHPLDVESLTQALPNVFEVRKINYSKFNHIDYLWGRDAKTLVYNDIIDVLKRL